MLGCFQIEDQRKFYGKNSILAGLWIMNGFFIQKWEQYYLRGRKWQKQQQIKEKSCSNLQVISICVSSYKCVEWRVWLLCLPLECHRNEMTFLPNGLTDSEEPTSFLLYYMVITIISVAFLLQISSHQFHPHYSRSHHLEFTPATWWLCLCCSSPNATPIHHHYHPTDEVLDLLAYSYSFFKSEVTWDFW